MLKTSFSFKYIINGKYVKCIHYTQEIKSTDFYKNVLKSSVPGTVIEKEKRLKCCVRKIFLFLSKFWYRYGKL
jgi:hypothetical protein